MATSGDKAPSVPAGISRAAGGGAAAGFFVISAATRKTIMDTARGMTVFRRTDGGSVCRR